MCQIAAIIRLFRESGGYAPPITATVQPSDQGFKTSESGKGIFAPLDAIWRGDVNPYPDCDLTKDGNGRPGESKGLSHQVAASIICDGAPQHEWPRPEIITAGQLPEETRACIGLAVERTVSCRAYDKSGLNSRPADDCMLKLVAPEGRIFVSREIKVQEESYRKLTGRPAKEAVNLKSNTEISGTIACTNKSGTGRTCEARATISAFSFPLSCDWNAELRHLTFDQIASVVAELGSNAATAAAQN